MTHRVLVIEPDPVAARQVASAIAQDLELAAEVATSVEAASAAAAAGPPDAVVVDVTMANEVLPAMRARDHTLAVVLTAAAADHEASARARSAVGPLGWVPRPVDARELLPRLAAALDRTRLARQVVTLERRVASRDRALDDSRGAAERTAAQLASASTELATATERLVVAEQLAAVGRVVGGIAHELGEQLALVGYAEALKSRVAHDPELVELADVIVRAQRRLLAMVDAIRDFTDVEPQRPLVREPADVAAVVEEALALIAYDREVRRRRIERRTSGHPICLVHRDKLAQVIINLVHNAALASQPGAPIEVTVADDGGAALVIVRDHGVGMEPAVLARLGEPFFTTRGARGSGLGVGICRRIVEEHGGTLAFESTPGLGTTARVRLPTVEPRA
jgi:signal transduction histidine kinase